MPNLQSWTVKKVVTLLMLLITIVPAGCAPVTSQSSEDALEGNITISGAFALYPMMVSWGEEYKATHPNVTLDISAGGAGKGMADTLSGIVDIGMVSREIKAEEIDQGAFGIAVTKDAVFLTANSQNPYIDRLLEHGMTRDILNKIFITGEYTTWGDVLGDPQIIDEIHVYTRSDSCGAAEVWSKYLGGDAQEDLLGIGVSSDPGLLDAVVMDILGIGFNNLNYAYDPTTGMPVEGAVVLPIDIDENGAVDDYELFENRQEAIDAFDSNFYPSPPARVLYVVTKGQPTGLVKDFIQWILTDGQQFVGEAGYIALPEDDLAVELEKLD